MNREHVVAVVRAHETRLRRLEVPHAALFGSVARAEATPAGDIDMLIELEPEAPIGVFEYVAL